LNCPCASQSRNQWKRMSIALVRFGCILLLITPSAVVLSVWIGVRGCGWPISSSMFRKCTASFVLMNYEPSSASAAEDITALMIVAMVRIAPLLGGNLSSFDRKKCPPAQLRDFFSSAYPASLWTANIILLALYVMTASSCVAQ
jgi:hypothetical protein